MKLEDHIRAAIRRRAYSPRTEAAYVDWYRRFVRFHRLRHPAQMGAAEVEQFLTHLAFEEQVSASTQNQAFSALLFLYREVLNKDLGEIRSVRAQRTKYVQPYLSHAECLGILSHRNRAPHPSLHAAGSGTQIPFRRQKLGMAIRLPRAGRRLRPTHPDHSPPPSPRN